MKFPKKYAYILLYLCLLTACGFGVYTLHTKVVSFSGKIHETQLKAKSLEDMKTVLGLYKKILVQGSKEQQDIERYLLSSKRTFDAVSKIEKDAKEAGLISKDKGGIASVTGRENAAVGKYGAHELVIQLQVEQKSRIVDRYIEALSNLPYVSHIEKVSLKFDSKAGTTAADITLVLTESQ